MSTSIEAAALPASRVQGFGLLLLTACCWGLNWPVAKFLLSELPPFSMRATCCLGAVGFGFLLAAMRGERLAPPRSQWAMLAVYATLNYGAFVVLTTLSLIWLTASEAVVVTYTLPIWAVVLAWPVLGERLTVRRGMAALMGVAGVVLLVGWHGLHADPHVLPGVACGLGAAMAFGLGTVIAKRRPLLMPLAAGAAWQILLGSVPLLLLAQFEQPNWAAVTTTGWLAMLYAALMPNAVAYVTWFAALRLLPASTATIGVLLAPVVGVFSSAALLGDPLGLRQVLALAITVGGIVLAALG